MTAKPGRADPPQVEIELAQSLGLFEALTIGIGTMIGAGIFVLPGLIIEKAGAAAVIAFGLGGLVALLNAFAAAEVATGMPRSGGAYYFISRALGPLWGAVIGWGAWFGLIFATGFYAMGFGEYLHPYLGVDPMLSAGVMTSLLVVLNLVGSKAAGRAQNLIVGVLVAVLALFLVAGLGHLDPQGSLGDTEIAPFGFAGIAAGTATLFVTYCGFGEIASMAEEIREPGRNLPRALIGSVVTVTVLYCLILTVVVLAHPPAELTGATVVADLASEWIGPWGRGAILLGAVLAMVSSANASIMSASRICFAMGRDDMLWPWLNEVHPRFRVPHRAIVVTGGLVLLVLLVGELELLAEAAGLLHLLMYGLMSLSCLVFRGARPLNYRPSYRAPLGAWVPLLGAAGTLVIACFLPWIVLAMGAGIIALAVLHYRYWSRRRTRVRGTWPTWIQRSMVEPVGALVLSRGAEPTQRVTVLTAVRNPHTERARLRLAAALLHDRSGRILALSVFPVQAGDQLDPSTIASYRETIAEREESLRRRTEELRTPRVDVGSVVPLAVSVLPAMLSAAEVSHASLLLLGWPAAHAGHVAQIDLPVELARHARIPVGVFHEATVAPAEIVACVDDSPAGALSLGIASRLAAGWQMPLTAIAPVAMDADDEELTRVAGELEERVQERTRARTHALRVAGRLAWIDAVDRPGALLVLAADPPGSTFAELLHIDVERRQASILLLHATPQATLETWT